MPHLIELAKIDPVEKVRSEALSALENSRDPEILKCLIDEVYQKKNQEDPDK